MPNHASSIIFSGNVMSNHVMPTFKVQRLNLLNALLLCRIGKLHRKPCRIHHAEWLAMALPNHAEDAEAYAEYDASGLIYTPFISMSSIHQNTQQTNLKNTLVKFDTVFWYASSSNSATVFLVGIFVKFGHCFFGRHLRRIRPLSSSLPKKKREGLGPP